MTSLRLKFDYDGIGDLALRGPGISQLVADTTEQIAASLRGEVGDENVAMIVAGKKRRRGYVRRLGMNAASDEVIDGALSRSLRGS